MLFFLCNGQWTARKQIGGPAGNTRSDDPEDPPGAGTVTRIWHRPPPRAGERGCPAAQRRHRLYLASATATKRLDFLRVGRFREQPQGPLLRDHPHRAQAACAGDRELGAYRRSDRASAPARTGEVAMFSAFIRKLSSLLGLRAADLDFDTEIATHVALLAERYASQGMSPAEAARAAHRQFGNTTLLKEDRRAM